MRPEDLERHRQAELAAWRRQQQRKSAVGQQPMSPGCLLVLVLAGLAIAVGIVVSIVHSASGPSCQRDSLSGVEFCDDGTTR